MAKLYVKYGTMGSAKSTTLLTTAHQYQQQGKRVLLFKPVTDTRSSKGMIESRLGISKPCCDINSDVDIHLLVGSLENRNIDCILVDEAQFLTREQVKQLVKIVDNYNINVMCYCLKNTYIDGVIFEAVQELLYSANDISELKSVCECCNNKATHHLFLIDDEPVRDGEVIKVGDIKGSQRYMSVCRKCYYSYKKNEK